MRSAILSLSLLAAVGCSSAPVRTADEWRRAESAADTCYLADRFGEAKPLYASLATDHPEAARRDHFRLREAQCLAGMNRSVEALSILDALRNGSETDRVVAARAHAVAGEIHRLAGRDEPARDALEAAAGGGGDVKRDAVLLSLARVCQRLGKWSDAKSRLTTLLAEFPLSPLRGAATELLSYEHFSIQVGAFRSPTSSLELAEKMTRSGVPAFSMTTGDDGGDLYCVRVGRYQTWPEANGAREELSARGKIARDAFLVP